MVAVTECVVAGPDGCVKPKPTNSFGLNPDILTVLNHDSLLI